MRKYIVFGILLALALMVGCGKPAQEAPKQELRICSSLGEALTEELANAYSEKHKTKVTVKYLPAGDLQQRLEFIRTNRFDLWLGGTSEEYYLANQERMLQPYQAKESYKVPAELRNRQGDWTSLYLRYIACLSNKNNLKHYGLYAPETWDELLVPQLKNEIVIPEFNNGGASFGMITSIWQMRGKERALYYAAELNRQEPLYVADVGHAVDLVYSGRRTVAIIPLDYALRLEEKYDHLFATVMKDANRTLLTGIAVMRGAGNGDGAKAFIDFLMSDEGVSLVQNSGNRYMWHVKNYPYNDGRRELIGNVQVPVDDLGWTAAYKSEIISKWKNAK